MADEFIETETVMLYDDSLDKKVIQTNPWIRGVNLGAWLVFERPFTPYLFAITDCDLKGDFHYFPGQTDISTNPKFYEFSSTESNTSAWEGTGCKPVLPFPVDMWTLTEAFPDKENARKYFALHWDNFLTRQDMADIKASGATHLRVPLPHWVLGDTAPGEPYVNGSWPYFMRMIDWAREENMQVWPDVHTAPGSQNGFDNSGHLSDHGPTCDGWGKNPENVDLSVKVVDRILKAIVEANATDVVTGFGPLNEPFVDCDMDVVRDFYERTFQLVKQHLGPEATIYMGDAFRAKKFNDGWWSDSEVYNNTYLDSHYYHVFDQRPRHLSPRQHIGLVCQKNRRQTEACCYDDHPLPGDEVSDDSNVEPVVDNTIPSPGISRIIGEWSSSFDTLPVAKEHQVMAGIATQGVAPEAFREISQDRQDFLLNFNKAQMVTYEAASKGISRGWFFWTFKTQGGALAEWDYLRGIHEGWMPKLLPPDVTSVDEYGTCYDIMFQTKDDMSIVHEFPGPDSLDTSNWQGRPIDDDVVVSHGKSLLSEKEITPTHTDHLGTAALFLIIVGFGGFINYLFMKNKYKKLSGYKEIPPV